MKLFVLLFLLKLRVRINIFKYIAENFGKKEIKLTREIQKQRSRIIKIQCDMK